MNGKGAAAVTALVTIFICGSANAYEEDVHYGLTEWLAVQAGFSASEAKIMADGAVSYDHSMLSATHLVFYYACGRKIDAPASRLVQENHFPGDGAVPGPASGRGVKPGGVEAMRKSSDQISSPSADPSTSIRKFGEGLHSLEDSWSHQGVPDTPVRIACDSKLSWGHPKDRGGWLSHQADLTYYYPKDTMAMAQATYTQMCRYSENVLHRKCQKPFSAYIRDIDAFARAMTKEDKRKWFIDHGIDDVAFLKDTNLRNGVTRALFTRSKGPIKLNPKLIESTEDGQFLLNFFSGWMTRADLSSLVKEQMSDSVIYGLGSDEEVPLKSKDVEATLALWRIKDHGFAAEMLHTPAKLQGISPAVFGPMNASTGPFESLEDGLLPIDESGRPFVMATLDSRDGPLLVGVARFIHAPNDSVFVFARKINGRYQVVGIVGGVEH